MKKIKKSFVYFHIFYLSVITILTISLIKQNKLNNKIDPKTEVSQENTSKQVLSQVTRVIDGDTFEIEGGVKVRLIGVDTPEMNGGKSKIECFAQEATNKLKESLEGKKVLLVKDVSEVDKYGRLLRYVYLDNIFINDMLLKDGYGQISTYPPDVKFVDEFTQSQKTAREAKLGLWSKCN